MTLPRLIIGAFVFQAVAFGCALIPRHAPRVIVNAAGDGTVAIHHSTGTLVFQPDSLGWDPLARRFKLEAAAGERASFDLRLSADGGDLSDLIVTVDPLHSVDGTPAPVGFDLYRVHPVAVTRHPGWEIRLVDPSQRRHRVFDVVVPAYAPRGGLPARLGPDAPLRVMGELVVPQWMPPGSYATQVRIAAGDETLAELRLELEVPDFALAERTQPLLLVPLNLATGAPADRPSDAAATIRLLRQHGATPVLGGVYPTVKLDRSDNLRLDWSRFDDTVAPYLDNHLPGAAPVWCRIPIDATAPLGPITDCAADPAFADVVTDYLAQCAEHFAERGWLERSYVEIDLHPEGAGPIDAASFQWAGLARRADRRLRTLTRAVGPDPNRSSWDGFVDAGVHRWIDIWCPPARYCDPRVSNGPRQIWMSVDEPPFSGTLDVTGVEAWTRVIPWQADRYGLPGVLIDGPSAEALIYSGEPFGVAGPVASMRLKHLARGMDDLRYLTSLRSRALDGVAQAAVRGLVPRALADACGLGVADLKPPRWPLDPDVWDSARHMMARALSDAGDESLRAARPTPDARWTRFIGDTSRVELSVDGVRMRPVTRGDAVVIECWITVENRTSQTVSGTLTFDPPPAGWFPRGATVRVDAIEPLASRRVALVAQADAVATNSDGKVDVEFALRADSGRVYRVAAKAAVVTSRRLSDPPLIDGDIGEWTSGTKNVASGFVCISGGQSAERDAPLTRCLVGHDDDRLYVGVYCRTSPRDERATTGGNVVSYDGALPTGADVFEVLLDPTNAGAHTPEELYHITIMESGAVFERGVAIDPKTGPRRVWPADIRYATRRTPEAWCIELSVPLTAFDAAGSGPRIWGANFAFYDHARQTYATWSGAKHNAYDPLSLGNLSLP